MTPITPETSVVLDACILLPMPLADTLLCMAEDPSLYTPRWTNEILDEVSRNLVSKFYKSTAQAYRRESAMRAAFPDAVVPNEFRNLIPQLTNHPKDRHVLAAAIHSNSKFIVTYNKKDFPSSALEPWNILAIGPSAFLRALYTLHPEAVVSRLAQQASDSKQSLQGLLSKLHRAAPSFIDLLISKRKDLP